MISHASFGQSAPVRQIHTSDAVQVPDGPTTQRRATRLRTDQRLHLVAAAQIQEARFQKLPQHLSAVINSALVEHTVSGFFCFSTTASAFLKDD